MTDLHADAVTATRRREIYVNLDGIRGLAAIFVVLFHAHPLLGHQWAPGGYLAVDLFFALSGFVVANAYEGKLKSQLTFREFSIIRIIRLYPLYALGALIGIAKVAVSLVIGQPLQFSLGEFAIITLLAVFFLPAPLDRDLNLFPLNVPSWSLFFELIVNFLYAALVRRLSVLVLVIVATVSALLLALGIFNEGHASIGATVKQFGPGLVRTVFSFTVGILIFRMKDRIRVTFPWYVAAVAVALSFLAPVTGQARPYFDVFVIWVLYPVLLACSFRSVVPKWMEAKFLFLGAISYTIYALHYPLIDFAQGAKQFLHLDGTLLTAALIAFLLLSSSLINRIIDTPSRSFLTKLLLRRK